MEAIVHIFQVQHYGEPVHIRPEINETELPHADMLRYDLAFCNPDDPSMVAFPVFRDSKHGRTSPVITVGRWRSFGMTLHDQGKSFVQNLDKWLTYRLDYSTPQYGLKRATLQEVLAQSKMKIASWRS